MNDEALKLIHEQLQELWLLGDKAAELANPALDAVKTFVATPPAAQRKPLTDGKIQAIHDTYYRRMGPQEFARAIEAAHGIK